ncbi:MAG: threonine--tRNA ligase [Pseudanabaena sp. M57BS1SP1A06MG]|nr:threonine--tRNA ligase [Pseudanabaena sp. M53BS1SP1A06MG]MCA6583956.1 threonine--tRNA ligase [Pseudanabaena sp. M34BS1SP1A06MG]MCA6592530.1 threonine--tRNA ligase [Pseudanabaena sp. M38BS1SP1A06MG]MCA6601408.1 threonine--tRNA ligase [Pseudanabaena sp. M57BS1SP1A06MG]
MKPSDILRQADTEKLARIRHTCSHVMAMAVQKLYPDAKVTIGPATENGFYYDFDRQEPFAPSDLKAIAKEMKRIIKWNQPLVRQELPRPEMLAEIEKLNEPYKIELLAAIPEGQNISRYFIGDPDKFEKQPWWDLCAGPHLESTGDIHPEAFALESIAGAYWRGDEKNPMLQRIYGTAWETPEQLQAYQAMLEEAKRRDHRTIGKDLQLFSIQEDAGGGLVFWHPKGAIIRNTIETFWKETHAQNGYEAVTTPHMANLDLWKISGHNDFYRDSMFQPMEVEHQVYQLKPMNCPFHVLIYKDTLHSYKEFPIRYAELGTVYRYERSGTMHGLMRVRGFTQDDAHIFCTEEQIESEILGVLNLAELILSTFGFENYEINLSTRPEKYVGSDAIWEKSTEALKQALNHKGWNYVVDEGGGAFYGPKIDIKIEDAIGRRWQCSTIQLDFNLPDRFEMEYVGEDGVRHQPIMIHRALFGSVERFIGVLIENYAGDFPLWLAPVQARLIAVSDGQMAYAEEVATKMKAAGLRVQLDYSGDRMAKQIRKAELEKVPVMAVIGAKEVEAGTLSIRSRKNGELGAISVDEAISKMKSVISDRTWF